MKHTIKVILIDPFQKSITEHYIEPKLQEYYKLIDCELVEMVRPFCLKKGNAIYIDEEELLKPKEEIIFFEVKEYGILAGKAIVIGHNAEGESISTTETIKSIHKIINFF